MFIILCFSFQSPKCGGASADPTEEAASGDGEHDGSRSDGIDRSDANAAEGEPSDGLPVTVPEPEPEPEPAPTPVESEPVVE